MSSKEAIGKFVSTIAAYFPAPKFESESREDEWLRSMSIALRDYSDDTLERATQQIINNRGLRREERWFPVPAEIRKVCLEVLDEDKRKDMFKKQVVENIDPRKAPRGSAARTKLVLDLVRGPMGQQAAREMWIGSLVDYVRDEMQLPHTQIVGTIKAKAKAFDELRGQCHAGVGWPSTPMGLGLAGACAKMADTIEARNQIWARVVLGEESEDKLFRRIEMEKAA
jgi:hypothetical protein